MTGGEGNDFFIVDNGSDIVDEEDNQGIDTILSSIGFDLSVSAPDVENVTLVEGAGDIGVFGNGQKNKLTGNSGDNIVDGDRDAGDTMIGGGGDDLYGVDAGDIVIETLSGTKGGTDEVRLLGGASYTLGANLENLTINNLADASTARQCAGQCHHRQRLRQYPRWQGWRRQTDRRRRRRYLHHRQCRRCSDGGRTRQHR
jgi:Ca2+-binding RTX toxin-like protein